MNDDLIKRLRRCFNGLEGLQTDQGDYGVLAEAAAALSEAQATIARQQVMLDRAMESNGDMQAQVARLREGLSRINNKAIMNAGEFARYVRNECAALEAKHG